MRLRVNVGVNCFPVHVLLQFLQLIHYSKPQLTTSGQLPLDDAPTFVLSNFGYKSDEVSAQPPLTIEVTVGDPATPGLELTGFEYEVTWFARDEDRLRKRKVSRQLTTDGNDVTEKLGFSPTGNNGYKLGDEVYATFRVRYYRLNDVDSSVQDQSPWSELVTSPSYKTGIVITPDGDLEVSECSENYTKFMVTLKTPVNCPTNNDNCVLGIRIFLERIPGTRFYWSARQEVALSLCQISLDNNHLNKELDVYLKGICDSVPEGDDAVLLRFEYVQSTYFWNSFVLVDKKIKISDRRFRWCSFQGDPHMQTFDGLSYSYFGIGDFVLYRNEQLRLQIDARLWPCASEGASCICGIAIREGNDLLKLKGCNLKKPWKFGVTYKTSSPSSFSSIQVLKELSTNNKFYVLLASGVEVIASHTYNAEVDKSWVNALIRVPNNTGVHEGMCGNYDGIIENDLGYGGDGREYTGNESGFGASWGLAFNNDSWFKKTPSYTAITQRKMCSCGMRAGWWTDSKPTLSTRCSYSEENHFQVVERYIEDITEGLRSEGRVRRAVNDGSANRVEEESDSEGEFNLVDFQNYTEIKVLTWPTASGLTEDDVYRYCYDTIFKSAGAKECRNVTAQRRTGNDTVLLENCIKDIQITGQMFWSSSALSTFQSYCDEAFLVEYAELAANETASIQSDGTQAVLKSLDLVPRDVVPVCPADCTGNGTCTRGTCVCNAGRTGQDCSLSLDQAPVLKGISFSGLCDIRSRDCNSSRVHGYGFVNFPGSKLSCHIEGFEVFNTTWNKTSTPATTAAVLIDLYQVQCSVLDHPVTRDGDQYIPGIPVVGLKISVSNDRKRRSNIQTVIVYDGLCLNCTSSGKCLLKENTCLINGRCYSNGDTHSYETDKSCQPESNTGDWTVRKDIIIPREGGMDTTVVVVAAVIAPSVFLICLAIALRYFLVGARRGRAEIEQNEHAEEFFFHY